MDEHLIFFIDLLGFREVVKTEDQEKLVKVTKMLQDFASWRSESALIPVTDVLGASRHITTPTITTFSDHIVMSYPMDHLLKSSWNCDPGIGLMAAQPYIARLASMAVRCVSTRMRHVA